eukprot:6978279-Lingulodinium_polyedra.AAC.1
MQAAPAPAPAGAHAGAAQSAAQMAFAADQGVHPETDDPIVLGVGGPIDVEGEREDEAWRGAHDLVLEILWGKVSPIELRLQLLRQMRRVDELI